jgi:hypothetical protein
MKRTIATEKADFHSTLAAPGRSSEIPESLDVYGWLIGSWELDAFHYRATDVSGDHIKGEAHFGWVLEGRAVQDVWIMPRRSVRTVGLDKINNMYGTTLRVWDPSIQGWRITWINPVSGHREEQVGRRSGKDIVQMGTRSDGTTSAGCSPRSPHIRSTGSAKLCSQMAKPGSSKASSAPTGFVKTEEPQSLKGKTLCYRAVHTGFSQQIGFTKIRPREGARGS